MRKIRWTLQRKTGKQQISKTHLNSLIKKRCDKIDGSSPVVGGISFAFFSLLRKIEDIFVAEKKM